MRLHKTIDENSEITKLNPKIVYLSMEFGLSPQDYFSKNELLQLKSKGTS